MTLQQTVKESSKCIQKNAISKLKKVIKDIKLSIIDNTHFKIDEYNNLNNNQRIMLLNWLKKNRSLIVGMNGHGIIKNK